MGEEGFVPMQGSVRNDPQRPARFAWRAALLLAAGLAAGGSASAAPVHRAETGPTLVSGFVPSGTERLYYEVAGAGEAVVLCHGLGGNHAIWFQQVPVLAHSFRVVTWDQRGFGRSTNLAGQAGPETAVTDLAALLDHLGIDQAHLVGQSMGGWAALGFALAHPERVRSLTLADSIAGIFTPRIELHFDAYIAALRDGPPPDALPLDRHPALGDELARQDPARAFLYRQLGSLTEPPPAKMVEWLRRTAWPHDALRALDLPVLFIVGSADPIFPPTLIREAAGLIRRARIVEIPGSGHSPYFEQPTVWNQVVLDFLREPRR
jgi:3-oxoadipate enol-lactonase